MTRGQGKNPYKFHLFVRRASYGRSRDSSVMLISIRGRFHTPRAMLIRWLWSTQRSCYPRSR